VKASAAVVAVVAAAVVVAAAAADAAGAGVEVSAKNQRFVAQVAVDLSLNEAVAALAALLLRR
jgi:hypothetical protein